MDFEVKTSQGVGRVTDDITIVTRVLESGQPRGQGQSVRWGLHETPVGRVLVGCMDQFLCWFGIVDEVESPQEVLAQDMPGAILFEDQKATAPVAQAVIEFWQRGGGTFSYPVLLTGTEFQLRVWETLLQIPPGTRVTYQNIADAMDAPTAVRAVGNAVGANPISVLVPCHRVVRKGGDIINYRWGAACKTRLLDAEAA